SFHDLQTPHACQAIFDGIFLMKNSVLVGCYLNILVITANLYECVIDYLFEHFIIFIIFHAYYQSFQLGTLHGHKLVIQIHVHAHEDDFPNANVLKERGKGWIIFISTRITNTSTNIEEVFIGGFIFLKDVYSLLNIKGDDISIWHGLDEENDYLLCASFAHLRLCKAFVR
ncbi:hypothetical protein ACJX0J_008325, partial [Zea mays]